MALDPTNLKHVKLTGQSGVFNRGSPDASLRKVTNLDITRGSLDCSHGSPC